ncbi:hypothetical protein KP509_02G092900 [Ceratopteris richardii]|uniref:Protein kinase domain-containing protein n=1 Tax=Ceratopteris richardii TaxID=49495 RepID=A0A8T2VGH9_CERRI|nr:hypothetical protein KP509_02G092900 [Ceratopteris richardii]
MTVSSSSISSWQRCRHIASGSFGHVSLALNLEDGSFFAAKSCRSSDPLSPYMLSLLNEFDIMKSLSSPYILRCLGADFDIPCRSSALSSSSSSSVCSSFFSDQGDTFSSLSSPSSSWGSYSSSSSSNRRMLRSIFLEYMEGGSLAERLGRSGGKFPDEALAAHYTRAILHGLDYLHSNGIVHCDIKPKNILIGTSGTKIGDFGSARRVGHESSMDGMLRGTPLYMAPEVVQGLEQGPPSDIWSLGCTLVHMLEGQAPWAHIQCLPALFLKIGNSNEAPPLPENISAEARDFLLQCLQRDPKLRPTAAHLLRHPFLLSSVQKPDLMAIVDRSMQDASESDPEESLTSSIDMLSDYDHTCREGLRCTCCQSHGPLCASCYTS